MEISILFWKFVLLLKK